MAVKQGIVEVRPMENNWLSVIQGASWLDGDFNSAPLGLSLMLASVPQILFLIFVTLIRYLPSFIKARVVKFLLGGKD